MTGTERKQWEVINGDCLDVLSGIHDVDLLFADPPYNIGVDYGDDPYGDNMLEDDFEMWCREWLSLSAAALTPTGSMWVMCPHELAWHVGAWLMSIDMHYRATITWYESFGVNRRMNFGKTSRVILYFTKDPKVFAFDDSTVMVQSGRQQAGDKRAKSEGKIMDDVWTDIPRLCGTHAERLPHFPTQLPLKLLRRIVSVSSCPGDLVVDPFSGSAATGVAAVQLERRYIGIERCEAYALASKERLSGIQRPLFQ